MSLLQLGIGAAFLLTAAFAQIDPGIRIGAPAAGKVLQGVTSAEFNDFGAGMDAFAQPASVSGSVPGTIRGLGPRFNLDSCGRCHDFPALGGSSPRFNPQLAAAPPSQVQILTALGLIRSDGPVRAVRFLSDGQVHNLFTIAGRADTPAGCSIDQPDFAAQSASGNIAFRIPTPTFGAGLIEAIPDSTIAALEAAIKPYGIQGRAHRRDVDGTIARFGWKAQNTSLLFASAEAFQVEQGITNDLFPDERSEPGSPDLPHCHTAPPTRSSVDAVLAASFMRLLAPPSPAPDGYTSRNAGLISGASVARGRAQFEAIGCAVCHTPSIRTATHPIAVLSEKSANLYSDLLLHRMGELGDGVQQGLAGPDEFRTAPLWGLSQRWFFLHDGRTNDLLEAIRQHGSDGSEAAQVIANFNSRSPREQQDLLNFLRSL